MGWVTILHPHPTHPTTAVTLELLTALMYIITPAATAYFLLCSFTVGVAVA